MKAKSKGVKIRYDHLRGIYYGSRKTALSITIMMMNFVELLEIVNVGFDVTGQY
jgi:hypothetical protein